MDTSEEKESESNLSDEKASLEVPVVNNSSLEFAEPKIKKTGQKLTKSDAETLFYNRQAFLRFNRFKTIFLVKVIVKVPVQRLPSY